MAESKEEVVARIKGTSRINKSLFANSEIHVVTAGELFRNSFHKKRRKKLFLLFQFYNSRIWGNNMNQFKIMFPFSLNLLSYNVYLIYFVIRCKLYI